MGDQVWPGSFPPDNHSSDFQVALLLKGMSRQSFSPRLAAGPFLSRHSAQLFERSLVL